MAGLVRDPDCYAPYAPETVGATRTLRLGRNSGRAAVAALLPDPGDDLTATVARIRATASTQRHALDETDFSTLSENSA